MGRGKERASDRTSESESQSERDRASLRLISCIVSLTQHDILSISFNGFIFSVFSLRCLHPAQRVIARGGTASTVKKMRVIRLYRRFLVRSVRRESLSFHDAKKQQH